MLKKIDCKDIPNKVNQKGACCYIISQNRNTSMLYINYILKKQKNNRQNTDLYKNIIIFAGTNIKNTYNVNIIK